MLVCLICVKQTCIQNDPSKYVFSIQNPVIQNDSQQYLIQDRTSLKELKNHVIMLKKTRETQAEKCLLTGQKGHLTI